MNAVWRKLTEPFKWRVYLPDWGEVILERPSSGRRLGASLRMSYADLKIKMEKNFLPSFFGIALAGYLLKHAAEHGISFFFEPVREALGLPSYEALKTSRLAGELSAMGVLERVFYANSALFFMLAGMSVRSHVLADAAEDGEDEEDEDCGDSSTASPLHIDDTAVAKHARREMMAAMMDAAAQEGLESLAPHAD